MRIVCGKILRRVGGVFFYAFFDNAVRNSFQEAFDEKIEKRGKCRSRELGEPGFAFLSAPRPAGSGIDGAGIDSGGC